MTRFRILPVVLLAGASMLTLKTAGLITQGHWVFGGERTAVPEAKPTYRPVAAASPAGVDPIITGSTKSEDEAAPKAAEGEKTAEAAPAEGKAEGGEGAAAAAAPDAKPDGKLLDPNGSPSTSSSADALIEGLKQRRKELDDRAKDIDLRESLLKAAEKRVEERINELKALQAKVSQEDSKQTEDGKAKIKDLVVMYENMKAKDAAKIFDNLDMKILIEVVTQMNPRKMADVMGAMNPEAAQKLTVALANRDTPAANDTKTADGAAAQ